MKRKTYFKKKEKSKKAAKILVNKLFNSAEESFNINPSISHRYVKKARRILMKHRLRVPIIWRRKYCRHCYCFLVPEKNSRIRINNGKITVLCKECNKYWRIPLLKKRK